MKITCQGCQAKYTIADEKVVGKVVKIRCKKCGAAIVVNGSQSGTASPQPVLATASAAARGPQEVWTVNVADGDQRTMTEPEIVAAYRAGVVQVDTLCWKEGTPEWLALQDIASLRAACIGPGAPVSPASAGAASPRPLGTEGNGAPAPLMPVAARRTGGRAPVADLFGRAARAGGDDEVMTSAPVAVPPVHADGQKATGARNENSILFSLNPLTEKTREAASAPPSMTATTEASGLIDIRQLSAQMRSSSEEKKKSRIDDIMNLGGGGAFSPSLGAPILSAPSLEDYARPAPAIHRQMTSAPPPQPRSKALVFLALGAGTFFLVGAVGIAVMIVRGRGPTAAEDQEKAMAIAAESKPPASSATMNTPPAAGTSETPRAPATPGPAMAAPPETTGAPTPPVAAAPREAPAKEAAKESAPKEPKEAVPKAVAAVPAGPAPVTEFNMGEAKARLAAIASGAQSCKRGDTSGSGRVEIVFAPSGGVQSASLISGPPFEGTSTGTCVLARFRAARVPPFGGSPFTVTKSFNVN
jgi:predicted Zn finger-like uncharacterized protein